MKERQRLRKRLKCSCCVATAEAALLPGHQKKKRTLFTYVKVTVSWRWLAKLPLSLFRGCDLLTELQSSRTVDV